VTSAQVWKAWVRAEAKFQKQPQNPPGASRWLPRGQRCVRTSPPLVRSRHR